MRLLNCISAGIRLMAVLLIFQSCREEVKKKLPDHFQYQAFKDSIKAEKYDSAGDNNNIFDTTLFTPGIDSVDVLLSKMNALWHRDIVLMEHFDTLRKVWKKTENYTPAELETIKENVQVLDSFLANRDAREPMPCREKDCLVYAEIIKSTQTLYLYLDGALIDSFPVSTGMRKYETPKLNVRPSGPLFTKYTSKRFPGGNYQGLGNMPYAVFIKGGYAIHGTTTGNFAKLGTRASHGCIRLHPVNARIFYELVKRIGINYTWVSIKDT